MMFVKNPNFFSRLFKTYPMLKLVDIYDHQSFIREYVLDNIYVCIFMYFLFYVAHWYANKAIKRVQRSNEELMIAVSMNRTKLCDVMALKDKRVDFEDVVTKAKKAQKVQTKDLDDAMKRLSTELITTANKMTELEKLFRKAKHQEKNGIHDEVIFGSIEAETLEEAKILTESIENVKILAPSFPPPEPPLRKYGVFLTRPPGQHRPMTPGKPIPKIKLK